MTKIHTILPKFFVFTTLLLIAATNLQTGQDFNLRPDPQFTRSSNLSYFVYEMSAGEQVADAVLVANNGPQALDLILYPADAETAANGGIAFPTGLGETPTESGTWIELLETEIHLEPGEGRSIPFRMSIPEGISGQFAGGIVVQPAGAPDQLGGEGNFMVNVVQRMAVTVMVTVEGEAPLESDFSISSISPQTDGHRQHLTAALHNTGQIGVRPGGSLIIRAINDEIIRETPLQLGFFLAGDHVDYRIMLDPSLEAGEYEATLALDYGVGTAIFTEIFSLDEAQPPAQVITNESEVVVIQQAVEQENELPILWIAIGAALILLLLIVVVMQSARISKMKTNNQ